MSNTEAINSLVDLFNERFSRYGLAMAAEDVERGNGVIESDGDDGYPLDVPYRFGIDADGAYLDYYFWYSHHQDAPDHIRLRLDRRDEELPVPNPYFWHSEDDDEETIQRKDREYFVKNRRISGMLCAKGFVSARAKEHVPVQVVYVSRRDANGAWVTTEELIFEWRDNYDEALGAAMWLVEEALARLHRHGMTANELLALYHVSGPDPHIRCEDRAFNRAAYSYNVDILVYRSVPFNAWGYAEKVSNRLCGTPSEEPYRSLAGWQGRYDRYDRYRMEAQLFLNRNVRLMQDVTVGDTVISAGTKAIVLYQSCEAEYDRYDFTREVPVNIDPEQLPLWCRMLDGLLDIFRRSVPPVFAVPYDLLECVDSDEDFSEGLEIRSQIPPTLQREVL